MKAAGSIILFALITIYTQAQQMVSVQLFESSGGGCKTQVSASPPFPDGGCGQVDFTKTAGTMTGMYYFTAKSTGQNNQFITGAAPFNSSAQCGAPDPQMSCTLNTECCPMSSPDRTVDFAYKVVTASLANDTATTVATPVVFPFEEETAVH